MVLEFLCIEKKFLLERKKKKEKKCRSSEVLNVGVETTSPGASNFETFVLLPLLVFELQRFESLIGFSCFTWKPVSRNRLPPKFAQRLFPVLGTANLHSISHPQIPQNFNRWSATATLR